jgi:hypothetical protein
VSFEDRLRAWGDDGARAADQQRQVREAEEARQQQVRERHREAFRWLGVEDVVQRAEREARRALGDPPRFDAPSGVYEPVSFEEGEGFIVGVLRAGARRSDIHLGPEWVPRVEIEVACSLTTGTLRLSSLEPERHVSWPIASKAIDAWTRDELGDAILDVLRRA